MPMTECRSCHKIANEYSGLCPDCDRPEPGWVLHGLY